MASHRTIATGLGLLHESFPTRDVTKSTGETWALLFATVRDADFLQACVILATERGRKFFPTPGEIMAMANPAPSIDADHILAQIGALGEHNPHTGWQYPSAERIWRALGDAVAEAYLDAGGARCFADNDRDGTSVTRDIARRAFGSILADKVQRDPHALALPAPISQTLLPSGL